MEKITLEPDQTISINGAVIDKKTVDFLLDLQFGIYIPGMEPRGDNAGIKEYQKSYANLILFMSKEADSFNNKEELASWFTAINAMMKMWSYLRIPGTKVSSPSL